MIALIVGKSASATTQIYHTLAKTLNEYFIVNGYELDIIGYKWIFQQ
jgi:hypothetical protein